MCACACVCARVRVRVRVRVRGRVRVRVRVRVRAVQEPRLVLSSAHRDQSPEEAVLTQCRGQQQLHSTGSRISLTHT